VHPSTATDDQCPEKVPEGSDKPRACHAAMTLAELEPYWFTCCHALGPEGIAHTGRLLPRRVANAAWEQQPSPNASSVVWCLPDFSAESPYNAVVQYSSTAQWYNAVVRCSGTAQCYNAVVQRSGTTQWYDAVVQCSGTGCDAVVQCSGGCRALYLRV
jgi:hypothetical protein